AQGAALRPVISPQPRRIRIRILHLRIAFLPAIARDCAHHECSPDRREYGRKYSACYGMGIVVNRRRRGEEGKTGERSEGKEGQPEQKHHDRAGFGWLRYRAIIGSGGCDPPPENPSRRY